MSRIINIILTELTSDILKYEETMEMAINNKELDINSKISNIRQCLILITQTERMIEKWGEYTSRYNNNNDKK